MVCKVVHLGFKVRIDLLRLEENSISGSATRRATLTPKLLEQVHCAQGVELGDVMLNAPKKLGVVTLSSTETEIVSTGERLPKWTWPRYSRMTQGEQPREGMGAQEGDYPLCKEWF